MADQKTNIIIEATDRTRAGIDSAKNNLSSINNVVGGISSSVAGLAGAGGILSILGKVTDETVNAANQQAQLSAVLKSTGQSAGFAQEELNKMAAQLTTVSMFSDDEISSAQVRMLSFTGVVGKEFPRAMQAVIDMSSRMGYSLEQSAETIGRALDIPSQGLTALTKQGFRFTEAQKELVKSLEDSGRTAEAQEIILRELEKAYGGAAEAARSTLGGALENLGNQFGELFELKDNGSVFASVINDLAIAMEAVNAAGSNVPFDWFDKMLPGYEKFRKATDEANAAAGGQKDNLILQPGARIDQAPPQIISGMPLLMSEGVVVDDLLTQIQKRADLFKQNNPLTDVISKQEEYRKKLEEVNKLEREGGLNAKDAARYRQQLADGLSKGSSKKETDAAARYVEQLSKQAEVLGLSKVELLEYEAANQKLTASQKATVDGLIEQIRAYEQLSASTKAWADQEALNQESDQRQLALLEEQSTAEQDAIEERTSALDQLNQQILRENEDLNAAMIADDKARAMEQLRIENDRAVQRIHELGLESDMVQEALDNQAEHYRLQQEELQQNTRDSIDLVKELGLTFESSFENALTSGFELRDMLQAMGKDIIKLLGRKFVTEPLMGGVTSILSNMGFADGGRPPVGQASLIGERGPELFIPDSGGTIVPNHAMGGDNVAINIQINADSGATSMQGNGGGQGLEQFAKVISGMVKQEFINQRRPGGMLA